MGAHAARRAHEVGADLIPILSAVPPGATYAGRPQVVAWAYERPDGGRGFGFTGGHLQKNWGNPDFRTLVMNAILWTAKLEVPSSGFPSTVSEEELQQNLDPKPARKPEAKKAAN